VLININDGLTNHLNSKRLVKEMFDIDKLNKQITTIQNGGLYIGFVKASQRINIGFKQEDGIQNNMFININNNIIFFSKSNGNEFIPLLIDEDLSPENLKQLKKNTIGVLKTKLQGLNQSENEFHKSLKLLLESLDINENYTFMTSNTTPNDIFTLNAFLNIRLGLDNAFRAILDNVLTEISNRI
jgi:hypothetical protein